MEIKDLTGLEKPLTKLIEVVAQGIGIVYTDTIGVNAEVRRREKIADVEQHIQLMRIDTDIEVANRMKQRIVVQELRRQQNIDQTVQEASSFLPEKVSDSKPDQDWVTNFFNCVQDISSDEIRTLWAKILAGEVAQPGSYSRRTLEVLKNLSPHEAKTFQSLKGFIFGNYTVFKLGQNSNTLNSFGISYSEWKILHEASLVSPQEDIRLETPIENTRWFEIGNKKIRFISNKKNLIVLFVKQLTATGTEISKLIDVPANEKYLTALQDYYNKQEITVEIQDQDSNLK